MNNSRVASDFNADPVFVSGKKVSEFKGGIQKIFLALISLALLGIIFRSAWVTDDAYILFRSLDQLYSGNGPNWNAMNRVQVYTSPLWYWMLALTGLFVRDMYLNAVLVSLGLMAVTLWYMAVRIGRVNQWIMIVLLLAVSNCFVDFSTSGLENPLIFVLCIVFFDLYILANRQQPADSSQKTVIALHVVAGFMLLTRHDLLMVVILPLLYLHFSGVVRREDRLMNVTIAGSLLFIWTIFSLFYYGVPLPNTAYAKLGMDVAHMQMLEQGAMYFWRGIKTDFVPVISIMFCIVCLILSNKKHFRVIGFSGILNILYILWIGGDFMIGRFYAHIFLYLIFSAALLFQEWPGAASGKVSYSIACMVSAILLFYGVFYPHTPVNSPAVYSYSDVTHGISDERGFYSNSASIWRYFENKEALATYFKDESTGFYVVSVQAGFKGYFLDRDKLMLDPPGLTDMFLARMPRDRDHWQLAHAPRLIPKGYPESVIAGKPLMENASLNLYFEKIYNINQSKDLFSVDRLIDIVKFNLGLYDHYLVEANLPRFDRKISVNNTCGHPWMFHIGFW